LAVRPAVGVVGREAEVQAMTDATKRVAAGDGREVLLISGEAGPGKTTLGGRSGPVCLMTRQTLYFAHSAASSARVHAKFFAARTDLMWGRMLAERRGSR
jgi:hypothetical protein